MKKLLLLLLCVPLMFSCGENEKKDNSKKKKLEKRVSMDLLINKGDRNGDVFYYENKLFNGIGYEVYLNSYRGSRGKLKREGNIKDGKKDGLWKWHYQNGSLKEEMNYKDGKENGLWRWYYENGQLQYEGRYRDGYKLSYKRLYYQDGKRIDQPKE